MKKLILILTIIAAMALIISCASGIKSSTTEVILLRDVTDKHLAEPDVKELLALFDFSGDNKWNGAVFHFADLSDVSYNLISEAKINTAGMWLSNEFERDKQIKNFTNDVSKILAEAENESVGKRNSSIYLPIAHQLNYLAQSKAQRRVLLVYSDLMENTIDVSFYNKKTLEQLQTNPETISKSFEQLQALQNLSRIEVYLIYQPTDSESDKVFIVVSAFYKKLLEDKGAKVNISASINL